MDKRTDAELADALYAIPVLRDSEDRKTLDEAANRLREQWKHDCEQWQMEGIGCAKCNPTVADIRENVIEGWVSAESIINGKRTFTMNINQAWDGDIPATLILRGTDDG